MSPLLIVGLVFAGLAALVHIYIWVMESLTWTKPATWKRFGIASRADAETIKPMALNQGFYNLFLGIGVLVGELLIATPFGAAIVVFACASMLAASLVLLISNPKLARAAATQGALPLIAVVLLSVGLAAS